VIEQDITAQELADLPIFAELTDEERQSILEIATTMEFEPGEVVLREGKASQNLMIVLSGKCEVLKSNDKNGAETKLAELGPRDHFGEMSFFHAAPHSATVRAAMPLKLLRVEKVDYERLIQQGSLAAHKLAYNILGELADRLRRMDAWVTNLLARNESTSEQQSSEWSHFRDKLFNGWRG